MFSTIANAMGSMSTEGGAQGTGSMLASMVPLVLMIVVFYFLLIRPQQKKAKEHQAMINSLKKGDKVITNAGLYGTIEEVAEDFFKINLGDVTVKTTKSAVSVVITPESISKNDK